MQVQGGHKTGGFTAITFVAVDAVEARGADAETRGDAEPSIHAARSTQC